MKKFSNVVLLSVVAISLALTGCAKKEEVVKPAGADKAHQMLVEGTVFLKQGEVLKAVESFGTAIKLAPDYLEAYFMLSQTFIHVKQFAQAQAVLVRAAERFPNNPMVYYFLSISYQETDNLMPAIVAARKSVDLFSAQQNEEGSRRATILLGVLVQTAKKQAEDKMVTNAAQAAAQAAPAGK